MGFIFNSHSTWSELISHNFPWNWIDLMNIYQVHFWKLTFFPVYFTFFSETHFLFLKLTRFCETSSLFSSVSSKKMTFFVWKHEFLACFCKKMRFQKKEVSFTKKSEVQRQKTKFSKMLLVNVHKVYPVSRKIVGNKFRPCWMAIKNETQILKFEKLWLWIKIVYLILDHIFSSFTKWNQKNSNFVR